MLKTFGNEPNLYIQVLIDVKQIYFTRVIKRGPPPTWDDPLRLSAVRNLIDD